MLASTTTHALCGKLHQGGGIAHRQKQHTTARLARARAASHASSAPHPLRQSVPYVSARSAGEGAHAHAGEGRVLKFFYHDNLFIEYPVHPAAATIVSVSMCTIR